MSDSRQPDEALPLPTWEALTPEDRRISHEAKRLAWSLNGPLTTSLSIMETSKSPNIREPYFIQRNGGDTNTSLHPISQSSLTEHKISSVTVSVFELEERVESWENLHFECCDDIDISDMEPDENGEIRLDPFHSGETTLVYGPNPDRNPDEEDDSEPHMLMCCGIHRPKTNITMVVKPNTSSGRDFVTIHDFVSTVHPWLMSLREVILVAKGEMDNNNVPLPADTKLMVELSNLESLGVKTEDQWVKDVTYVMWTPPSPTPDDGRGDYLYSQRLNEHIPTGDAL